MIILDEAGEVTKEQVESLLTKDKIRFAADDPQSFCPWCKRTHAAPEFFEYLRELEKISGD